MPGRPSSSVPFEKYEGLGNDFILIDDERVANVDGPSALALCDRHRGVGADGVLLVRAGRSAAVGSSEPLARMRVINADGSVPEMCGNGLRCVALHLWRATGAATFDVETDAGIRSCVVEDAARASGTSGDPGSERLVTVGMGPVRALGPRTIDVDGETLEVWLADAGNPHAVAFGVDPARWHRLAPAVSVHPSFPRGTNVELAAVGAAGIDLVVWERGVGLTMACGTGACAAVAVAAERGILSPIGSVDVRLPGGILSVSHDRSTGATAIRGPARWVFSGSARGSV